MIWLDGPLVLGLGGTQVVLLALTAVLGLVTVSFDRATVLQGVIHLVVLASFLLIAAVP